MMTRWITPFNQESGRHDEDTPIQMKGTGSHGRNKDLVGVFPGALMYHLEIVYVVALKLRR